jgi:cell division septation protein DedD
MMTPNFSAPERFEDAEPDELANVYALGATLFAMLSGHAPFSTPGGSNAMSTMRRILADPVPLGELPDSVPDYVQDTIAAAMTKNPDDRTASAAEFAAQLRNDGDSTVARPAAMSAEIQSWPDRSKKKRSEVPTSELPPAHKPTASKPFDPRGSVGSGSAAAAESGGSGSRTMWLVGAAALVVAGIVGVVALGGGGDDGETDEVVAAASIPNDAEAESEAEDVGTTTTSAAATTTEAPETTTTTTAAAADAATTSLAPAGILSEDAQPADGVLTIAGAFPLTGTLKFAGPAPANAMQIAVDEINAAGGVLGVDVEALVIDTKSESEGVFGAFQDARTAGADSVLSGSGESRESIRLAELTALPLISERFFGGSSPLASPLRTPPSTRTLATSRAPWANASRTAVHSTG